MAKRGDPKLTEQRLLAMRLLDAGATLTQVSKALSRPLTTISRWKRLRKDGGLKALVARKHLGGSNRKLTAAQEAALKSIIECGPKVAGHSNQLWTLPQIQVLIANKFGQQYDVSGVYFLARRIGCRRKLKRTVGRLRKPKT